MATDAGTAAIQFAVNVNQFINKDIAVQRSISIDIGMATRTLTKLGSCKRSNCCQPAVTA